MGVKLSHKVEGDQLKVMAAVEEGIDSDKDGIKSVSFVSNNELTLDGSEILNELLQNNELAKKAYDKLKELGLIKE